jgi:hypothetical protein
VNKSILSRGHAITILQHLKPAVLARIGTLYHSQRTIDIVNATGEVAEGRIRHSFTTAESIYSSIDVIRL